MLKIRISMTVSLHLKVGSKLLGAQSKKKKERHACYKNTPKFKNKKKRKRKKRDTRTYN